MNEEKHIFVGSNKKEIFIFMYMVMFIFIFMFMIIVMIIFLIFLFFEKEHCDFIWEAELT